MVNMRQSGIMATRQASTAALAEASLMTPPRHPSKVPQTPTGLRMGDESVVSALKNDDDTSVASTIVPAAVANQSGTAKKPARECDFDKNPTKLYLLIQDKKWDEAARRSSESPPEAYTWVSRRERDGKLRWRLLPLHAAIIFKAPERLVEALLCAYPP
eukprot:CAMPEP_0197445870 /NCGR_PEP_ID=MMETSP1175-20131217/10978_1 /TAXON_ID=1003142 /ORGANISM="Triceratium dubium, Strain CCMP147" /LENGTH=158 /DNA_ID=CAMNT_0042976903 /DNA_START=122 /DNA_END=594 /DNA_ORIENTATION=-